MSFCYQDVYVTLDPWAIEASVRSPQASLRLQQQLDLQLQIHDIGFVGTRGEEVSRPLEFLGLPGPPAITQTAAWLRKHVVQGPALWRER